MCSSVVAAMDALQGQMQRLLLEAAFPGGVPALITDLLPPDWDPAAFGAGPIFSSDGAARFYVADAEDREAWTEAVLRAAPDARELLEAARPGTRRMVDTDGDRVDVYLDDLHLRGHGAVMCEVHHHPSGARSRLVLVDSTVDLGVLSPAWGVGRFARRVGDRESLLWISEAKHTGRAAEVEALAASMLTLPPAYRALKARLPELYVEGVELHPDGRVDLTPGVL